MKQKLLGALVGAIISITYIQARITNEAKVATSQLHHEQIIPNPNDDGILRDFPSLPLPQII